MIYIIVRGGLVHAVYADHIEEVEVLDLDLSSFATDEEIDDMDKLEERADARACTMQPIY